MPSPPGGQWPVRAGGGRQGPARRSGVACRWRIRHKLMLGLGLVVAILALLLGGTLKGLMSYRATMKAIDSKLVELNAAIDLRSTVAELRPLADPGTGTADEPARLQERVKAAKSALNAYEEKLRETITSGRDPTQGFKEFDQVDGLRDGFGKLDKEIQRALQTPQEGPDGSRSLLSDPGVRRAIDELVGSSNHLNSVLYDSLQSRITRARKDHQISLGIVVSTSVVGVLMMASL